MRQLLLSKARLKQLLLLLLSSKNRHFSHKCRRLAQIACLLSLSLALLLLVACKCGYGEYWRRRRDIGPSMRYVSVCPEVYAGDHRIGNHLYIFAAVAYAAQRTRRRVAMPRDGWILDETFETDVTRVEDVVRDLCPCDTLAVEHYNVDGRLTGDEGFLEETSESDRTLLLCGLGQTFRYAEAIENGLETQIRFTPSIAREADEFLRNIVRTKIDEDDAEAFLVGVHVRRGDFLLPSHADYGLTVVDREYLRNAFRYFTARHERAVFVVASDDWTWTLANLPSANETASAEVVFSNNTASVDLAVLSKCDAVIISTGSFGWWAAWFANRTTVYYPEWPRNGSNFSLLFNRENYFPPKWIPIV